MPGMINPRSLGKSDFADDLSPHVQGWHRSPAMRPGVNSAKYPLGQADLTSWFPRE
jgi:hypothetical protein